MATRVIPMKKLRGDKPQSMQISKLPPTPTQAQNIKNYHEMRKRGAKDSIDITTLEENISVNKPKISGLHRVTTAGKNKEIVEELKRIEEKHGKRTYNVVKKITQLPDRPVEWLEIVKMDDPLQTQILETET